MAEDIGGWSPLMRKPGHDIETAIEAQSAAAEPETVQDLMEAGLTEQDAIDSVGNGFEEVDDATEKGGN